MTLPPYSSSSKDEVYQASEKEVVGTLETREQITQTPLTQTSFAEVKAPEPLTPPGELLRWNAPSGSESVLLNKKGSATCS